MNIQILDRLMKMKRICKICGKSFFAIKVTQFFCCRNCFKKDYYSRTRVRINEEKHNPSYPIKKCNFCSKPSKLNFDPIELPKLFDAWGCPYCGATNKVVWEHHNDPNSHQIIQKMLVSFHSQDSFQKIIQYQTYQLPIKRLEQGNPSIVVMTCEKLNIVDIQRKNRKKILFS